MNKRKTGRLWLMLGVLATILPAGDRVGSAATICGRFIFYNGSYYDGNNPSANIQDDSAIAPDKTPLLPGDKATFVSYTSYYHGINGIMIDILGLPATPTASDFAFHVGNWTDTGIWLPAPAVPLISVRAGAGVGGSDRITLLWPDNAIQKEWLQVAVWPTANTGLPTKDVFYWGNAIGDTGGGNTPDVAIVNVADYNEVVNNPHILLNPASIIDQCDFNRDRLVNDTDLNIVMQNGTSALNGLQLMTLGDNVAPEPATLSLLALGGLALLRRKRGSEGKR